MLVWRKHLASTPRGGTTHHQKPLLNSFACITQYRRLHRLLLDTYSTTTILTECGTQVINNSNAVYHDGMLCCSTVRS